MKAEYLIKKCPKCGCKDKRISRRNTRPSEDGFYIQHIPQGNIGIIKCDECGYVFEFCKDSKLPVKVKKIQV
ncbi:MAG: TIGR04165 family Cys-rich peptide [Methanobacteriaceae archaeon]|nr:TIGR04165 family Cys-rich peptide [Methanobacteriaceae archaeon]